MTVDDTERKRRNDRQNDLSPPPSEWPDIDLPFTGKAEGAEKRVRFHMEMRGRQQAAALREKRINCDAAFMPFHHNPRNQLLQQEIPASAMLTVGHRWLLQRLTEINLSLRPKREASSDGVKGSK